MDDVVARAATSAVRRTQAQRRQRSRSALLESAARGLSRYGYANLSLEQVARDAGYSRGALYHQFSGKQDLALAVVAWVDENWQREVGQPAAEQPEPLAELLELARGHAVFCRRDIARVAIAIRLEFAAHDHPVGRAAERVGAALERRCTRLIEAGRRDGTIAPGPPARTTAAAFIGALEGVVIGVAGRAPHDALLAVRTARGVLGVDPS